jgi:hypothetical protein
VLAAPLTCTEPSNRLYDRPKERPALGWSNVRLRRIADVDVFSDGRVMLRVAYTDAGIIECQARLTSERMAALREDIARTKAWQLKMVHDRDAEWEGLEIRLDRRRRCSVALTPREWQSLPATRALQRVIDQLKSDVCGGPCPEPKNRTPRYERDRP